MHEVNQTLTIPRLREILDSGVPPEALAFYGRWWQLETWLRELVYVELRSKYGISWTQHLRGTAPKRATSGTDAYMASADSGDLLAYADVAELFALIDDQWEMFAPFLPPQRRWRGTTDELRELRNRNAHWRRPQQDDLSRIEQTLRDLEAGARLFYRSYHDIRGLHGSRDPVAQGWYDGEHPEAQRLIDHAKTKYDVWFNLYYSVRPWAKPVEDEDSLSGHEGVLWHAVWTLRGCYVNALRLWTEVDRPGLPREALIHLLVNDSRVTATFAAVDNPAEVADEIGYTFDDILVESRGLLSVRSADDLEELWTRGREHLPRKVQVMSVTGPRSSVHLL